MTMTLSQFLKELKDCGVRFRTLTETTGQAAELRTRHGLCPIEALAKKRGNRIYNAYGRMMVSEIGKKSGLSQDDISMIISASDEARTRHKRLRKQLMALCGKA